MMLVGSSIALDKLEKIDPATTTRKTLAMLYRKYLHTEDRV
jgi:hypothetical protein